MAHSLSFFLMYRSLWQPANAGCIVWFGLWYKDKSISGSIWLVQPIVSKLIQDITVIFDLYTLPIGCAQCPLPVFSTVYCFLSPLLSQRVEAHIFPLNTLDCSSGPFHVWMFIFALSVSQLTLWRHVRWWMDTKLCHFWCSTSFEKTEADMSQQWSTKLTGFKLKKIPVHTSWD